MPKVLAKNPGADLCSIQESADHLGVSTKTIRRYVSHGTLPARRIAGSRLIRIRRTDLDQMLRPIPTTGGPDA